MATQRRNEWQQGLIIPVTDRSTGEKHVIVISRKTGFQDVWIGDQHLYYNAYEQNTTGTVALQGMIVGIKVRELKKKGQMAIVKGGRK